MTIGSAQGWQYDCWFEGMAQSGLKGSMIGMVVVGHRDKEDY